MKIIALFCLLSSCSAFAGIGETAAVCGERYGEPKVVKAEEQKAIFVQGGLIIIVHFHEGICDHMVIGYVPDQATGTQRELTDEEQTQLRNANSGGRKWKVAKKQVAPGIQMWVTEDGKVLADYSPKTKSLHLYSDDAFLRSFDILTGLPK